MRASSDSSGGATEVGEVPCPFCALLCDDLRVATSPRGAEVIANGCERSHRLFAAGKAESQPRVAGKLASIGDATTRAAGILHGSHKPLFVSAGLDVSGMRSLLALAERTRGIVDHADGDAAVRNILALQDGGWVSTTLTEMRNRADLLVVVGDGITRRMPRFLERCFGDAPTLFDLQRREAWFIGDVPRDLPGFMKSRSSSIPVEASRLAETFSALQSLASGRTLATRTVAGIPCGRLAELASRMREARYGVLAWSAADLAFPHADLAVRGMCELVRQLNKNGRFAVLPLAGNDADVTMTQVTAWQAGYPLRISFAQGFPEYDPRRYAWQPLLEEGGADALVWAAALDPSKGPPETGIPSIVLGRPGMLAGGCDVFIPVSTPGIHHAGHLYRTDNVVALRMRSLIASSMPSAAVALDGIMQALGDGS